MTGAETSMMKGGADVSMMGGERSFVLNLEGNEDNMGAYTIANI